MRPCISTQALDKVWGNCSVTLCSWYCQQEKKKKAQPKSWELCFTQWIFCGLEPQDTASQITVIPLLFWSRKGGTSIYRIFCNQRTGSQNIKISLLIKENQISQVTKLGVFLCMGRCKSLGSPKSLVWWIPWTEEHGGLQSIGLHGGGHDWSDLAQVHRGNL